MLNSFLTFINQLGLNLKDKRTLLAISGGIDSVVMLNLFHKAGFQAGIAHCNFGLRGEESNLDEQFVAGLADSYRFPIYVRQFETKAYARTKAISTQMAARELRYDWFEEVRNDYAYDFLATAHHANDNIETAILNLSRGTGIAGLSGITPRNGSLIRPLLFSTKEEILAYAKSENLFWREDASNDSDNYKRNLIRHKVVPVLKELNPALEHTFLVTAKRISAADTLLREYLIEWKKQVIRVESGQIFISIKALSGSSELAYRLWFLLEDYGFSYSQAVVVSRSLNSLSGKLFYSETHVILKNREELIVKERVNEEIGEGFDIPDSNSTYIVGNKELRLESLKEAKESIGNTTSQINLDAGKLLFPLSVRAWAAGDMFCPLGMGGKHKKVSDLLVDMKVSLFDKQQVNLLINGNGDILWVIGLRADNKYRVTEVTDRILRITLTSKSGREIQ